MNYINDKVRRQDRLLDEPRARQLLSEAEFGVLSMVDDGEQAYGIPVNLFGMALIASISTAHLMAASFGY